MRNCKEYLEKQEDGTYALVLRGNLCKESDILIPEGANIAVLNLNGFVVFYKDSNSDVFYTTQPGADFSFKWESNGNGVAGREIIWQREQDEPFLTPETTLNDQCAEIEKGAASVKAGWNSIDMQRIENVAKAAKAVADSWSSIGAGAKANTEIHGTAKAKPDFNFGAAQESGGVDATLAERQTQYGCYEDVAQVTQQILSALRIGNYDKLPAPMKESLHMIASKMARIVNGDPEYVDNWHDICGYAKLIEKLIKGE